MNAVVTEQRMGTLVEHEQSVLRTPMSVLLEAIQQNTNLERLEKLMDLAERWQAAQAKQAYVSAFAKFKRNMPDVVKDMLNKQYGSDYSSLANLVNTTNKVLGEYDLNASWKIDQTTGIKVTCVMTHAQGHSEEVSVVGAPDNSGQKNPLQQVKSALTYLEGATFQAITGVVARSASQDDDGNGSGKDKGVDSIPTPEGYATWKADMQAVAEEGMARLQDAWAKSDGKLRGYAVTADELWWRTTKNKAAKVKGAP